MRLPTAFLVAAVLLLGACATRRGPAEGPGTPGYPYNVEGAYVGSFVFDGQPFGATLRLSTSEGGRVGGAFRVGSPVEIDGPVTGVVIDDLLRITVEYTTAGRCDARIEGILTVERGGAAIEGPVTVADCDGPVAGRMEFVRREPGGRPTPTLQPPTATGSPPERADR